MRLTEIPKGFRSLLPDEAEKREEVVFLMEQTITLWGYELIIPPSMEFLSTFKAVDERFEELSFKVVDRETGKLIAVRPDFTPQVARIIASSFKSEAPPFRFYYKGKVFRDIEGDRESYQFGFELIGVKEVEADAEVVAVVVNILENLGLKSFQIDIGHSEFLKGAMEELELPERDTFINLLSHKDISGIEIYMNRHSIPSEKREKISEMLELYGKGDILDKALQLFSSERVVRAVEQLKEILSILKSYGFEKKILFDLTEKRGMEYHTGVTFEVFHPLLGESLGAGGRYDQLISKFGRSLPATGIAINVDALQELLEKKGLFMDSKKDFYIIDLKRELHKAYEIAKGLRSKGFVVARDIVKRNVRESIEVAFKKGYRFVVVLNREEPPYHILYTSPEGFFELDGNNLLSSILEIVE